jgi:HEAT repeat protein
MTGAPLDGFVRYATALMWTAVALASAMLAAVIVERAVAAWRQARERRLERAYRALVERALAGDETARGALARSPARHHVAIAWLLITPVFEDREPERIARTRALIRDTPLLPLLDRYLHSWWWWRRALGLRGLGLVQMQERAPAMVAALDDGHPDVRGAALDALADLKDPMTLPAIVVRLHDGSLHRGRRTAALAAFGSASEGFLLDLAEVDPPHRVAYARALALCGSERSRSALVGWTDDARPDLRAAAFEALAHVGLDERAALRAIDALADADVRVRAMAARALHGWLGIGDAATALGRRLDDEWPVAVHAARSLRSLGQRGALELQAWAARPDLAGVLAREMLWQENAQW